MKKQTITLLAVAGIAGLAWWLYKTRATAQPATTASTGTTLADTLAGKPPKTILETLAGLIANSSASPASPPSATAPLPTPAPTVSAPTLLDMYDHVVRRVGQPKPIYSR